MFGVYLNFNCFHSLLSPILWFSLLRQCSWRKKRIHFHDFMLNVHSCLRVRKQLCIIIHSLQTERIFSVRNFYCAFIFHRQQRITFCRLSYPGCIVSVPMVGFSSSFFMQSVFPQLRIKLFYIRVI